MLTRPIQCQVSHNYNKLFLKEQILVPLHVHFYPTIRLLSSREIVNLCHSIYSIRMSKYHPRKRQVGYKSMCKRNSGPVAVSVILCSVKFEYERFCFLLYLLSWCIKYKYTQKRWLICFENWYIRCFICWPSTIIFWHI